MNLNYEWISAVLILIIGFHMTLRSYRTSPENWTYRFSVFRVVFVLALALALPAFIIGIGFAFTEVNLILFLIVLAAFGILLSLLGVVIGKRNANFQLGNKINFLGGVLLTGLALKQALFLLEII